MNDPTQPSAYVQSGETLPVLASMINADHATNDKAARDAAKRAKKIGDMLLEAKDRCGHGQWMDWLKKNILFTHSMAARYMKVASNWSKLEPSSTLTEIYQFLSQENDMPQPVTTTDPTISAKNLPLCFHCDRNVRIGRAPEPGCPDCKKLRANHQPSAPSGPVANEPTNGTEPPTDPPLTGGSDTKPTRTRTDKSNANGAPVVTVDAVAKAIGEVGHLVDTMARQFGLVRTARSGMMGDLIQTPEIKGINRLLEEVRKSVEEFAKNAKKKGKEQ